MNKEEIQYLIDNAEYETQPLLDYITNLQEENKESEEAVKYWQNQCDLRQRAIDKALDYIKEYGRDKQLEEEYLMSAYNLAMYNITLLEILGDKENE